MSKRAGSFRSVRAIPGIAIAASALIGLLLAYFSIGLLQNFAETRARTELEIKLGRLQETLSLMATRNRAMGVALLLGLNEPTVKRAALRESGLDAPELLQRLAIARRHFGFEGLYVIDKQGQIIANDTDGPKSTGKSIAFRPYFQSAIKGQESVYLAIGSNSNTRGLFVASPIRETTETDSAIIGVIAIKLSAEAALDNILSGAGEEALLISPQGIVFASTRKKWQLTITSALDDRRLQEIRDLQQFGPHFENASPAILGFDPTKPAIDLDGRKFIAEHVSMDWQDPNGLWTAVLMEDSEKWLPEARKLGVAGSIFSAVVLAGFFIQQQINRNRLLKETLAKENAERVRVQENNLAAAEKRAVVARIASELRQVRSLSELVQTFMHHVSDLFDIRLGVFYVADNANRKLRLIGGYGVSIDKLGMEVAYGEGMAGQCAVEEKSLQITPPPEDYLKIESGGGSATPRNIYLHPLFLKGKLVGVLELASFGSMTSEQEKILSEFEVIAAANIELMEQRSNLEAEFRRQQESEASLRRQASLQQALIDTIPYPIFYKGADSRFLGFNKAYEQTFNVNRQQLIGKRVLDLDYLPIADRAAFQAEDEKIIAEVGQVRREVAIPFADGRLHQTLYFVSGFHLEDGRSGGLVGIFIDLELTQRDIKNG
ncbi:MAG TPA: cache domain-containing protein [Spongiibacteraceae bacterium]|nr:cache domain-containing protein [Spongiibacteraceae bacterium]